MLHKMLSLPACMRLRSVWCAGLLKPASSFSPVGTCAEQRSEALLVSQPELLSGQVHLVICSTLPCLRILCIAESKGVMVPSRCHIKDGLHHVSPGFNRLHTHACVDMPFRRGLSDHVFVPDLALLAPFQGSLPLRRTRLPRCCQQ